MVSSIYESKSALFKVGERKGKSKKWIEDETDVRLFKKKPKKVSNPTKKKKKVRTPPTPEQRLRKRLQRAMKNEVSLEMQLAKKKREVKRLQREIEETYGKER